MKIDEDSNFQINHDESKRRENIVKSISIELIKEFDVESGNKLRK